MDETKPKRKYQRRVAAETLESRMAAVELDDTPVSGEPAPKMLTQDELFKLRLYEAEVRHARAESETARMRKKWILALLDPQGSVEKEEARIQRWLDTATDFAKKYENVKAHASMRLGIDLSQCGFDTDTGLVVPPDPSAKGSK